MPASLLCLQLIVGNASKWAIALVTNCCVQGKTRQYILNVIKCEFQNECFCIYASAVKAKFITC